jgi:anti-sigma factor RsiW
MNREDDDKLWDLLGHSAPPQLSPFFARNVMREIRQEQGTETSPGRWHLRWLMPVAGVALVVIAGLAIPTQIANRHQANPKTEAIVSADGADADLIADLEELVGSDDSAALEDSVLL